MQITSIEKTKRGRYSIFLDGEFYCVLHSDVYYRSGISAGGRITPEEMEALHRESELMITKDRALRLLGQRAYTEQGLYRKLCERTDSPSAAAVVARMRELGLVDDWDYARRYMADCINLKGFAHRRVAVELSRKGIDRQMIDEVLSEAEEDPQQVIADTIKRKYIRYIRDEKGRNKTTGALLRLGFRHTDINCVIENLLEDEDYYTDIERK